MTRPMVMHKTSTDMSEQHGYVVAILGRALLGVRRDGLFAWSLALADTFWARWVNDGGD